MKLLSQSILPATVLLGLSLSGVTSSAYPFEIKDLHALARAEEVFAYARISASGRFLVYASYPPPDTDPRAIRSSPPANGVVSDDPIADMRVEIMKAIDLKTGKVLLSEPGIDGFWSNDERRLIYLSRAESGEETAIWHRQSGLLQHNVVSAELGAYYSWGVRSRQNLILTIFGNYFFLDNNGAAILPVSSVAECPQLGRGERPLLSRDGQRISVFVGGILIVRNLTDCKEIVNTGLAGAKADFSWDNRYLAFHAPKTDAARGYEIKIVDLKRRTVRSLSGFKGSSLFPSWTRDGRLAFRYEGEDYNGFRIAKGMLSLPEQPLPLPAAPVKEFKWSQIFPETLRPSSRITLVLIWATWSPYSAHALASLEEFQAYLHHIGNNTALMTATDLMSPPQEIAKLTYQMKLTLPRVPLSPSRFVLTEAVNQIPTTLLFIGDRLADRRLGAQNYRQLVEWLRQQR